MGIFTDTLDRPKADEPTTKFAIERGVPIPARRRAPRKYPFDQMQVGDSFAITPAGFGKPVFINELQHYMSNTARSFAQRHGGKFTTRIVNDRTAVRVWRVK